MNLHHLPSHGNPKEGSSGIRLIFDQLTEEVSKASHELSVLLEKLPNAVSQYRQAVVILYEDLKAVRKLYLLQLENLFLSGALNRNQQAFVASYLKAQLRKYNGEDKELLALFQRFNGDAPAGDRQLEGNFPETDQPEAAHWEKARAEHRENRQHKKKQEQNQLMKRSLKTVYIGLMKVFHPDTETDPERKAEKEEISKQITVAYGKQDFIGLLKLESEFLTSQKMRQGQWNDRQLEPYIGLLKEQKTELLKHKEQLKTAYGFLFDVVATGSEKVLKQQIKSEKSAIGTAIQGYQSRIRILKDAEGPEIKMLLSVMADDPED